MNSTILKNTFRFSEIGLCGSKGTSPEEIQGGLENRKTYLLFILFAIFMVLGLWGRINALGRWPLAEDEYYFMKSVFNILHTGIPEFPTGGYYIRGILQQYTTGGLELLLNNPELSGRIIPVIANICAIPAVYIIGRKIAGRNVAVAACCLFLVSSWEIEFSRFARMYSAFQCVFLWFLVYIITSFKKDAGRYRILFHLTIVMGLVLHQGAIFMVSTIAAIYLLHLTDSKRWEWALIPVYGAISFVQQWINFRRLGAPDPWPEKIIFSNDSGGLSLPIDIPSFLLQGLADNTWALVAFLCVIAISIMIMISGLRKWRFAPSWILGWLLAWIAVCFNQLFFSAMIVVSLLTLQTFEGGLLRKMPKNNAVRLLIYAISAVALFWVGYVIASVYFNVSPLSLNSSLKYLINYPRIFARFIEPWLEVMPFITAVIGIVVAAATLMLIFKPLPRWILLRQAIGVMLIIVIPCCMIDTEQISTRYTFFIYPFMLILLLSSIACVSDYLLAEKTGKIVFWAAFCGIIFLGNDFSVSYPFHAGSRETNFRLGADRAVRDHYYDRISFREAAEYVNDELHTDDIVISGVPVVDFYLARTDAVYFDYRGFRFLDICAVNGTRDLWSSLPLINDYEDLKERIENNKERIWIILQNDLFNIRGPIHKMLANDLKPYLSYQTFDKRINVYSVPAGHAD